MPELVWGRFVYPITTREDYDLLEQEIYDRRVKVQRFLYKVKADHGKFTLDNAPELETLGRASFNFLDNATYGIRGDDQDAAVAPITTADWLHTQTYREPLLGNLPEKGVMIKLLEHITEQMVTRKAQVWKAVVNGQPIIAKIYQACYSRTHFDSNTNVTYNFFPEEMEAHSEAWAYDRLKSIQGRVIPHSYGFFKVCGISLHLA